MAGSSKRFDDLKENRLKHFNFPLSHLIFVLKPKKKEKKLKKKLRYMSGRCDFPD